MVRTGRWYIGPLLNVMEMIAQLRNKSVAQVALNYMICKGVIPIPGARTAAQVDDNIGSMNWRLSDIEVSMLEDVELGFGFEGAGFKRTNEKFSDTGLSGGQQETNDFSMESKTTVKEHLRMKTNHSFLDLSVLKSTAVMNRDKALLTMYYLMGSQLNICYFLKNTIVHIPDYLILSLVPLSFFIA
jgi:Aldo/keto reductase family